MTGKDMEVRLLRKGDDRSQFHCGDIELDRFFQRYAGQNQFRHYIGSTYVADIGGQVAGYVTVSSGDMTVEQLSGALKKRLPDYPLPILRISRLAVDQRFQGVGIGKQLLRSALLLACEMKSRVGCVGVVVDAKAEAVDFYRALGFEHLETLSGELGDRPQPTPMFLTMRFIEQFID